jgi:transposase
MNACSKDLRLRVLQAVDRGLPRMQIAELFGVSPSTIKRYVRRRRQGEDLKPKPSTGRKRRILATSEQKRALWRQLEENDEATLQRHCELWEGETGVRVSLATMSRAIREKLGWTLKIRRPSHRARRGQKKRLQGAHRRGRSQAPDLRGRVLHEHSPHP